MSKDFYNDFYKKNNNLAWNDAPGKKVILNMYVELVKDENAKVLDIGGGSGYFMNELSKIKPNNKYFSCDISEVACKSGEETYPHIKFETMDAQNLCYEKNMFDCVVSYGVYEHIEIPSIAIKELYQVLKKDGLFLFMMPSLGHYREDRDDEGWYADFNVPPQMQWNYTRETWDKFFLDEGFVLENIAFSKEYDAMKPGVFFIGYKK